MFKPVHYQIKNHKIAKEIKIVHLSDLHGASYGQDNSLVIQSIQEEQPDLVVMTGDMVDERDPSFHPFLNLCQKIADGYTTYYIPGNHEQRFSKEKMKLLLSELKRIGVTSLINRSELLLIRGRKLRIYGLVTPMEYYKDLLRNYNPKACLTRQDTERYLGPCDLGLFTLLLSHNPLYFNAYHSWGADLTLSGHIHGGIVRIPGMGGLLSPEAKFFPKYDGGCFEENGKHLIVSRGLGNNFGIRINNPPELVYITIGP